MRGWDCFNNVYNNRSSGTHACHSFIIVNCVVLKSWNSFTVLLFSVLISHLLSIRGEHFSNDTMYPCVYHKSEPDIYGTILTNMSLTNISW